jgi:hypothetical protein
MEALLVEVPTLDGIVREHVGEPGDSDFVSVVLSDILASPAPERLLTPMIRQYLLSRRRALTRDTERSVWQNTARTAGAAVRVRGAAAVSGSNPVLAERLRPLIDELIYIPGAGRVRWGAATIPQLEARAAMYESHRRALDRAVGSIAQAISTIRSVPGASCLDDVLEA